MSNWNMPPGVSTRDIPGQEDDCDDAPRERPTDPMENWIMKPALEWLEQAEHGENKERCRGIAALLRDPNAWLHQDCKPLDTVEFDERNEVLFGACDSGMCFV